MRCLVVLCLALTASTADGQSLHFEEASFKASPPANGKRMLPSQRNSPGRIERQYSALRSLIVEAYEVRYAQVIGPDWLNSEHYDLIATLPADSLQTQVPLMLQALLAERLALEVHREQREEPVYAVEVAKSGSKLRQADGAEGNHHPGSFEVRLTPTTKILTGNLTVAALLRLVAPGLDRQMIDATDLKDSYEFKLEWIPPDFRAPGSGPPGRDNDGNVPTASMSAGTDLFVALEKQLGLKVVARKGSVEIIVVDHAERVPVEN
jgi:uncharacterized protein (TIGR03435 family)